MTSSSTPARGSCTGACTLYAPHLFSNKVALVTGGGTGIGYGCARELLHLGAYVIIASRKLDVLQTAANELLQDYHAHMQQQHPSAASSSASQASSSKQPPPRITALQLNIRDEASVRQLFATIQQTYGRLDLLVCSAGGQFPSPAAGISYKGWKAVVETNLTGTWLCCQAAYHLMSEQPTGGSIVTITADFHNGFAGMAHTGAARAGVDNLTKSLAVEWAAAGIRVNSVAPGTINSSGLTKYPAYMQSVIAEHAQNNYALRFGSVQEVVAPVLFLLSPGSSYVTGATLRVDAAQSLYAAGLRPDKGQYPPAFDAVAAPPTPKASSDLSHSASTVISKL